MIVHEYPVGCAQRVCLTPAIYPPIACDTKGRRLKSALLRRITLSLMLAMSVALASSSAYAQQRTTAETHAQRATEQVQAGNLVEAESELREAVRLAPNDLSLLAGLGTVLAMERKFPESNAILKKVLTQQPAETTVRRYLAANLWQMHRYPEARQNLEIILQRTPQDKESRFLLGMVAENMKDYAKAAEALASVPELTERRPESIAALARSYYHIGKAADAQTALRKIARFSDSRSILLGAEVADEAEDYKTAEHMLASIAPDSANRTLIEYRIALTRFRAKHFDASRDVLLTLIQQNGGSSEIYNLLGWCYYNQAELNKAMRTFERAIELFPGDEANYLDLIKIHLAKRSFSTALHLARDATTAFPNSARAYAFRGSAEEKMEQFRDAMNSFTEARRLDPAQPDALLGLARAQSSVGMRKESAANFESGMKLFPRDLRFKVQYASSLLKQAEAGDAPAEVKAQTLLESALAADDSLASAHYQLGNLALRKGQTGQARDHLEKAEKLDPSSSEIHFALARAYRRLGRKDQSAHEMELYKNLTSATEVDAATQSAGEKPD